MGLSSLGPVSLVDARVGMVDVEVEPVLWADALADSDKRDVAALRIGVGVGECVDVGRVEVIDRRGVLVVGGTLTAGEATGAAGV